ncbi:MAG: helix-turn-helix transcriptional regulator [Betaproteobacteria bacterium]|nr:helix-turn-helix transcriptional regulator [Betaproteobacteria bacterium]
MLARDGFGAVGVNAIARQAGVDKVLIYRYFDGLPALLRAWGESGRFWPRVADLCWAPTRRRCWRCPRPSATRASSSTSSTNCGGAR